MKLKKIVEKIMDDDRSEQPSLFNALSFGYGSNMHEGSLLHESKKHNKMKF